VKPLKIKLGTEIIISISVDNNIVRVRQLTKTPNDNKANINRAENTSTFTAEPLMVTWKSGKSIKIIALHISIIIKK
jgi:hypothetical protein